MMKIKRRHFLSLGAGVVAMPAVLRIARADDYPSRPVRIIVPYPPGIAPDIATRLLTDSLSKKFQQQFIVDNRPGGAANIGTEMVVRAAPDGYTLLTLTMTNSINVSLYDNLSFDITKDIAPVSGLVKLPLVIVVNPVLPVKTLPEFIAYAKANPGKINYPSVGAGAATNMAGELFKQLAGVDIVNVPYKNSYIPDLLAGQVQAGFTPILQVLPFIQAGKLARHHRRHAFRGVAGSSQRQRVCAGLRSRCLGRGRRSGSHAARHRRQAEQDHQRSACRAGDAEEVRRSRLRTYDRIAGRSLEIHGRRGGEVGQGGARGAHQARLSGASWACFTCGCGVSRPASFA